MTLVDSSRQLGGGLSGTLQALSESLAGGQPDGLGVTSKISLRKATPDLPDLLAMPLDQFVRDGQLLEVRVPWHSDTLWLVPDEHAAGVLGREGVSRGRVWTAAELIAVMALPGLTPAVVQTLALAKLAIDGDLVMVGPRSDSGARPPCVQGRRS